MGTLDRYADGWIQKKHPDRMGLSRYIHHVPLVVGCEGASGLLFIVFQQFRISSVVSEPTLMTLVEEYSVSSECLLGNLTLRSLLFLFSFVLFVCFCLLLCLFALVWCSVVQQLSFSPRSCQV